VPQSREIHASRRYHPSLPESALDSRQDHSLPRIRLSGEWPRVQLLTARPSVCDPRRNQPQRQLRQLTLPRCRRPSSLVGRNEGAANTGFASSPRGRTGKCRPRRNRKRRANEILEAFAVRYGARSFESGFQGFSSGKSRASRCFRFPFAIGGFRPAIPIWRSHVQNPISSTNRIAPAARIRAIFVRHHFPTTSIISLDTRHGNSVDRQAKAEHNVSVTEQLMLCNEAKGFLLSVFQLTKRPIDWLVGKPGKRTRRLERVSSRVPGSDALRRAAKKAVQVGGLAIHSGS